MEGALSELAGGWRTSLLRALAFVEATIDFADEDVPEDVLASVGRLLAPVRRGGWWREVARQPDGGAAAEGFEVALVGSPERRQVDAAECAGRAARRR